MATSEDYLAFVQECFSPIVAADYRKMFGGIGIFDDGTMFALITSDDELFFRVDDRTRPGFEAAGSGQFMSMPYFSSPADALEDRGALTALIADALAASKRAAEGKGKRRKRGSSGAR
jgi:DNA transformation protein